MLDKITYPGGGTDMLYNIIYAYVSYMVMSICVFVKLNRLTCPVGGQNMVIYLETEFFSVTKFPRKGKNRPDMPRNGKHVTVPCNRIPFCC